MCDYSMACDYTRLFKEVIEQAFQKADYLCQDTTVLVRMKPKFFDGLYWCSTLYFPNHIHIHDQI